MSSLLGNVTLFINNENEENVTKLKKQKLFFCVIFSPHVT